ncbi:MAG: DUF2147 domain-containing protein [Bacteroidia bacterium]
MKKQFTILLTILLSSFALPVLSQNTSSDDIVGLWETGSGKARVLITKVGNFYYGRIVWLKEPLNEEKKPKTDKNNPDESKRSAALLGLKMLSGFEYKGENNWENGTIYDPESGSTYNCVINMVDKNTMNIRGFIGIAAFGRTDVWKRLEMKKK